ncbi:hypothetical protein ACRJ4W_35805 [Streptomyces sp. GLT-R25]
MLFGSRVPLERVVSRLGEPYVDPTAGPEEDAYGPARRQCHSGDAYCGGRP